MGCSCSKVELIHETTVDLNNQFSDVLRSQISEYPLLLYSYTYCEQSKTAKQILRKHSIPFEYFEIDRMNDQDDIRVCLDRISSSGGTPYVFLKGNYYGTLSDLMAGLKSGDLSKIASKF